MTKIELPTELEQVVANEAARKGTTVELLALDVLQEHFVRQLSIKRRFENATLADALANYIGAINTRDKYPEGSTLSEDTGRKFARKMVEKHRQGKL